MTFEEILNETCRIAWGDSPPPVSVLTSYRGSSGVIARCRRRIQQEFNYWFMEATDQTSIVSNVSDYDLPTNFKEEIAVFTRDADNDTYNELKKLGSDSYTDYINKYEMPDIYGDHILNATTLSTGTTPEEIASTAFDCRINGVAYTVAAADSTFTAADTINTGAAAGSFWGVWLIQVNSAGTISTSSPSADQVYTTEALAIAALPSVTADNVSIGYVAVQSNSGASWTANTDDLTAGSDCLDLNYYNTASAIDADQNTEWPLYYYIMPTSTVGTLRIIILPLPEESKTEALYIRYWKYLPDLSNTVETWDAYEDEISTNCPDLLIWMGVADIAVTQENQNLAMMAQSKIALHKSEFKNLNFTQKNANMGRIPYRWI